jgi:hypothetical protein
LAGPSGIGADIWVTAGLIEMGSKIGGHGDIAQLQPTLLAQVVFSSSSSSSSLGLVYLVITAGLESRSNTP